METLTSDKRINMIFASISVNIFLIIFFLLMPEKYILQEPYLTKLSFIAAIMLILLGDFDVIRNKEGDENEFLLARFRWLAASLLLSSVINQIFVAIYAYILNIALWWVLLFLITKLLFSGYYAPVRRWTAVVPVICISALNYFVFSIFDEIYIIVSESLMAFPMIMLVYLCLKYYRQASNQRYQNLYIFYIGNAVILVILEAAFSTLYVYGMEQKLRVPYFICTVLILISFTFLLSITLRIKSGSFAKEPTYHLILIGSVFSLGLFLWQMFHDLKTFFVGLLVAMTFILIYEIAESLHGIGDKILRHKNAIMQYRHEMSQNKKVSEFLHDEILQDLYAAKMIVEMNDDGDEVIKTLERLQRKIREEMENHSVNLEKSMSYKENLEMMLMSLKKRYSDQEMEIYTHCDDDILLTEPYDEMFYCMIRELTTNAFKHGRGTLCDIILKNSKGKIYLMVRNDGMMIQEETHKLLTKGFGLASMNEQITALGGSFHISANVNGGLVISIEL